MDILFLTGLVIRELTHTALSDVAGGYGCLFNVSMRGDKVVVCGRGGAALFNLIC